MANAEKHKTSIARKIANAILWVVVLLYFPIVMPFVNAEKALASCTQVKTKINNSDDDVLLTTKELAAEIKRNFPNLEGTRLDDINLAEIESRIAKSPAVASCEVFPTAGGTLHIEVSQREPIMHVFSGDGSYYMDANGYLFPAQKGMHANAVVVNGYVNRAIDHSQLIEICNFIRDNKFWRSQIEQIYVDERQEFILVPRVGNHLIYFGKTNNMERKFDSLHALYSDGWEPHEWNLYSKVDLRYAGQIICTKRKL